MRCRTGFAGLMAYLILQLVIKQAHGENGRVSSEKHSALKAPALKQTNKKAVSAGFIFGSP